MKPSDPLSLSYRGSMESLSKDEGTLFVTEYKARKVHAFPIDDGNVKAGEGTLFAEIKTEGSEH